MPRIGRFPPFEKRFFRQARKMVGSCHFAHFWRAVIAIASMHGRRNLKRIERACRNHHTRQSIGFFLTKAHWDAPEVLAQTALDTLKGLGYVTPRDVLEGRQKEIFAQRNAKLAAARAEWARRRAEVRAQGTSHIRYGDGENRALPGSTASPSSLPLASVECGRLACHLLVAPKRKIVGGQGLGPGGKATFHLRAPRYATTVG